MISFLMCSSTLSHAQVKTKDSIPVDDYSNRKFAGVFLAGKDIAQQKASTLVIIDNKFYFLDDKTFTQLDPSSIKEMTVIKDEKSRSSINNIILITTKYSTSPSHKENPFTHSSDKPDLLHQVFQILRRPDVKRLIIGDETNNVVFHVLK